MKDIKIEKNDYQGKGYVIYRQLINETLADVFMCYLGLKRKVREQLIKDKTIAEKDCTLFGHIGDTLISDCYSLYGDTLFDTIMVKVLPTVEEFHKKKLYPTYSYARVYDKGHVMEKHLDRDECEVSITMNLGGDLWPIFIKDLNNNERKIDLGCGDALIYQGSKCEHWREPFNGKNCFQVFFHYVTDKHKHLKFDERPFLGIPYKKIIKNET
tara:strand:- start:5404 stop:6042 length:639 start_codon:yes stop_codon:yes gene_type:complete